MHLHTEHGQHYPTCVSPKDCWCEERRLLQVLGVSAVIFGVEVLGGLYSGSLALLSDAGHVLSDNVAIMVALLCTILPRHNFNKKRTETVGFNVLIALLALVVVWIIIESIDRFKHPNDIQGSVMIVVAFVGGLGNILQHSMLSKGHDHKMNRALLLHIISDGLQSVVVVFGGIIVWITGWYYIDPILSIGIALFIAYQIINMVTKENHTHDEHHHH